MSIEKYKISEQFSHAEDCQERINTMCANEVSGLGQSRTTFTPEEQAELKARLEGAKTQAERSNIFTSYAKEVGVVVNVGTDTEVGAPQDRPVTGTVVEKNSPQKGNIKTTSTTTFSVDDFMKNSGLDDSKRQALIKSFMDEGMLIDEDGNASFTNKEQYNTAVAKFAKENRMSYLSTDENGKAIADNLAKQGKVKVGENGQYVINGADGQKAVEEAFPTQTQAPVETKVDKNVKLNTTVTTITEENSKPVEVAKDLKHDRAGRKQARKDFEAALSEWVEQPENESTMMVSIAKNKYAKAIDKKAAKISKEYANKKSDIELITDYMAIYGTEQDKKELGAILVQAEKASEEELYNAWKNYTKSNGTFVKDLSDPKDRNNAVIAYAMDKYNFDRNVIINRMATVDVMSARSNKQVAEDKKDFIKDEAKRQTKAAEAKQNVENTRIFLTKEDRKKAEKEAKAKGITNLEFVDIGKAGRKLVEADPERFCDEKGNFSAEKFRNFCKEACEGSMANENGEFGEDANLTLNEGRDFMKKPILRDKYGNPRSIEQIIGNKNGKISNGELNDIRHLIETAGNSTDKNSTNLKRAWNVTKGVAIGAGLGFATAGLSSVLAGAVNLAGTTAAQTVGYSGRTNDRIIHDRTTVNFNFDGENYKQAVDKYIKVDGQDYSGEVTAKGQDWQDEGNNHLKTATNAAIFGGIAGGAAEAMRMGKIHADGRNFDGIVNLNQKKQKTEVVDKEQSLEFPQFIKTEGRAVETNEPPKAIQNFSYKIKVSHQKGTNYNMAEDRLDIVKKMYNIQDDVTANKVLDYIMTKINGYKKNPYKTNYAANLTYHFPSEIPAGMIDGITDNLVGTDPNSIGHFDRNKIILGKHNGPNANESRLHKPGQKKTAQARITTK